MSILFRSWLPEGYYEEDGMGGMNSISDPRDLEDARKRGDLYYNDGMGMSKSYPDTFEDETPVVLETCNLFLDDFRVPEDAFMYTKDTDFLKLKWVTVVNYDEFVRFISTKFEKAGKLPDLIAFDHDLGDEHYSHVSGTIPYENFKEKTGYDCAKWLVDFCMDHSLKLPQFKVHSMNPAGAENIKKYLENFRKHNQ
jgi:hypothetical protein